MRLPPQPGERLKRDRPITFLFDGKAVQAFEGDTLASALFASGRRVFSRSFKYHRPRGLLCCSGHCPNCLVEVDGVPTVRACMEPAREGAKVKAQNVLGSLDRDLMSVVDKVGGPFLPVGFYYRTMMRPRRAWPIYERFLRNAAGLGRIDRHGRRTRRFDTEHRRAEVLVVGGGASGTAAAQEAADAGRQVVLVDEGLAELGESSSYEVLSPARAIGIYEGGLVPVAAGQVLYRFRADRIIVATGAIEQPLLFPGNDLVGVMLSGGARRLIDLWSVRPGVRAVVLAADGEAVANDLRRAGTEVARVFHVGDGAPEEIVARGRKGRVSSVAVDGERVECDLLVMSGGRQPAYSLLAQAGARVEYDAVRGIFVPQSLPTGVEAVGAVSGERGPVVQPAPAYSGKGRCFVCICEDVTRKDVQRALAEGFDSVELAKRYTAVTWGLVRDGSATCPRSGSSPARPAWAWAPSGRRPRARPGRRCRSACSRDAAMSRPGEPPSTTGTRSWAPG